MHLKTWISSLEKWAPYSNSRVFFSRCRYLNHFRACLPSITLKASKRWRGGCIRAAWLLTRSLSIKFCVELWAQGEGYSQFHTNLRQSSFVTTSGTKWFGEHVSFKVHIESFNKKLSGPRWQVPAPEPSEAVQPWRGVLLSRELWSERGQEWKY